jgi:acetate kinase
MPEEILLASGKVEKDGNGDARLEGLFGIKKVVNNEKGFSVRNGLHQILTELITSDNKCLQSQQEIDVVGHRLIHGCQENQSCVEVSDSLIEYMHSCLSLAPLHYPANIEGIKAVSEWMPQALQTGVFDTAFHHTMPEKAFLYGIPLKWYKQHQIRKYGFHGTSHKYVAKRVCEITGLPFMKSKIISCHLGNGASIAAIKNGQSVDTSMGMTPVEGLLMGTRSGDIDAGVLIYLQEQLHLTVDEVQNEINKEGGLLGLSGVSSDYRDVFLAAGQGNTDAQKALDVYYYRIKKYIGAYAAAIGGLDAVVFTGGVGENSSETRWKACDELDFLGIQLSQEKNTALNGTEAEISTPESKVKVFVIPTNEELIIAREAFEFTKTKQID